MVFSFQDTTCDIFHVGKDSTKWINRTLKNMGEAPVIFDSVQARLSVDDLRNTLKNMGYMHATVDLTTKVKGKKMTALYMLHPVILSS